MSSRATSAQPPGRPANWLWESLARAHAWAYRSGLWRTARLQAPVVSIGNLTFGGTGKTPFTIWLAEQLGQRGYRVSILTRGYRRTSKGVRIYSAGRDRPQPGGSQDGDEAQLLLRHLSATAVGVAARRHDAGVAIEKQAAIDVHLLDDGFQHLQLARACDIVLIDASNPWGARTVAGRTLPRALREPIEALRRAQALVLTRCEQVEPSALQILENNLRRIHPAAPVFHSRTHLTGFRTSAEAAPTPPRELAGQRAVAFCGLGNPENFLAMLRGEGIGIAAARCFPDHHHYNDQDIDQLNDLVRSHGAACLITTEKDVVNLPHPARFADSFIAPAYWADISPDVQGRDPLLALITEKIGPPRGGSRRD
jgi:tetraacyldisaccharide 4'-kinase